MASLKGSPKRGSRLERMDEPATDYVANPRLGGMALIRLVSPQHCSIPNVWPNDQNDKQIKRIVQNKRLTFALLFAHCCRCRNAEVGVENIVALLVGNNSGVTHEHGQLISDQQQQQQPNTNVALICISKWYIQRKCV